MNTKLEGIKTRIRELKTLNEDQSIEEKVFIPYCYHLEIRITTEETRGRS